LERKQIYDRNAHTTNIIVHHNDNIKNLNDYMEESKMSSLKEMADDDEDLMKCIVDQYLKDFPLYLKSLSENIAERNFTAVQTTAHKMKSALTMMGMEKTKEMMNEMENLALSVAGVIQNITDRFEKCKVNIEKSFCDLSIVNL
jgi:HPt (histidine-containing phosphotransfer) domain-containing protein